MSLGRKTEHFITDTYAHTYANAGHYDMLQLSDIIMGMMTLQFSQINTQMKSAVTVTDGSKCMENHKNRKYEQTTYKTMRRSEDSIKLDLIN
jgi:hypothetical protein